MNINLNVIPIALLELIIIIIFVKIVMKIVRNVMGHIQKIIQIVYHALEKTNIYILEIVLKNAQGQILIIIMQQ